MKNLDKLSAISTELETAQALVAKLTVSRDKEIVKARNDGWPWPALQDATGLSRQGVNDAAKRLNKGVVPVPRQQRA